MLPQIFQCLFQIPNANDSTLLDTMFTSTPTNARHYPPHMVRNSKGIGKLKYDFSKKLLDH